MKKPSAFRLIDIVTLAIPALLVNILVAYVSGHAESGTPTSTYVLLWIVAGSFGGLYTAVVYWRFKFLGAFKYTIPENFFVDPVGYKIQQSYIAKEINRVVDILTKRYPNTVDLIKSNEIYVRFNDGLLPAQTEFGIKRMGYVVAGGNIAYVAYTSPDQPVNSTALGHEIGHIIIGRATNNWDCEKHHAIMQELGIG